MRTDSYLLVAVLSAFPLSVHAETVVQCGNMEGYAYFYPSPFVKDDQLGFEEKQVSKSSIAVSVDGDRYDIARTSVNGKISSSIADGAKTVPIANNENHFVLFVTYPDKAAEIYTYNKPSKTLTMLQLKYGALVTSSKLMVTDCEQPSGQ